MVECLIDQVPDEATAVGGVALQSCVQLQATHRVTHRVHVLARKVGLRWVIPQIVLDCVGQRVHARLNVRDIVELAIPGHALVVDRARRIELVCPAVHRTEDLAAERLVAQ